MQFELLSDSQMTAAKAFGIAYRVSDAYYERLREFGNDLEEASGEKHHLLPVPAVFIVGTDGMIKFEYVNPNYRVRLDADVLLAAVKAALKEEPQK